MSTRSWSRLSLALVSSFCVSFFVYGGQIHLGMKYRTVSSQWKGISEGMAKETVECILDQRRHPILVMCKYARRAWDSESRRLTMLMSCLHDVNVWMCGCVDAEQECTLRGP